MLREKNSSRGVYSMKYGTSGPRRETRRSVVFGYEGSATVVCAHEISKSDEYNYNNNKVHELRDTAYTRISVSLSGDCYIGKMEIYDIGDFKRFQQQAYGISW